MSTTLQRLLKYPHSAVFGKDARPELAFSLTHPDIASWSVAERRMVAKAGAVEYAFDLSAYSVETLADALSDVGFGVSFLTSDYRLLSAMALVEGESSELVSNGSHLHVYTSLLWVILSAYSAELHAAGEQIVQALRQMIISTASGDWLDLWGKLYAVPRLPGELDSAYSVRIPVEAFRIRVNARAIELAIRDATGYDVRIEEPWERVFTLDESELSGPDRLYDGGSIGYHLIKPVARTAVDWAAVFEVIHRNRAAGVLIAGTHGTRLTHLELGDPFVHFAGISTLSGLALYEDTALLDYSEIGEVSVPNHPLRARRGMLHRSGVVPGLPDFVAAFVHTRDYRFYRFGVVYQSNYWTTANGTWAGLRETWATANPAIRSRHTSYPGP